MSDSSRRGFIRSLGAALGAGAVAPALMPELARASDSAPRGPLNRTRSRSAPLVVASSNGLDSIAESMDVLRSSGDTLEAVLRCVNPVEADPEDQSVGYGGLPNADGVVQLDSQVWHGPTRGAGAVAALEGYVHPSRVAVAVMRYTDHVLLVGQGAARFAREMGFESQDLLTEASRQWWLRRRASLSDRDDYLSPDDSAEPIRSFEDPGGAGALQDGEAGAMHSVDGVRPWGTIHCGALSETGDVSAVTTTSGLAFKVPGRVGDSPLPGCGCYADNDVGTAGSTGRGEAVIKTIGAHLIVEEMRRGAHPTDACLVALRRIVDWTTEPRLLNEEGIPNFNVNYYALNKNGDYGGAALWSGARFAVQDGRESRLSDSAYLFERR